MSSYQLVISVVAQNDLRNIYQFGLRRWGNLQSVSYLNNLKTRLLELTQQPLVNATLNPQLFAAGFLWQ